MLKSLNMKSMMFALLAATLLLVATACGSDDTGGDGPQEITVAVVQDYPPFEYVVDGELTGFDVEIIEAIAENQNLIVNWDIMRFDGIIPGLQANQMDAAVSAITIRDDRAEVVDFSDPYFESGLSLVVAADSHIQSMEDLEGAQFVAKQGTSGLEKARELADQFGGDVTVLQDDSTMYMELASGNADAMINDYPSVAYKMTLDGDESDVRIVGDRLTGENYGIAVSKQADGLLNKMNAGLAYLHESGKYEEIYNKYFAE